MNTRVIGFGGGLRIADCRLPIADSETAGCWPIVHAFAALEDWKTGTILDGR
jgi:hypothetical protein